MDGFIPEREAQALREVGQTAVSRATAWSLVAIFLGTVFSMPLIQAGADWLAAGSGEPKVFPRAREAWAGLQDLGQVLGRGGAFAANRELQVAIDTLEDRLEDDSLVRQKLLPRVQRLLTAVTGIGNEEAYVGRGNWLFYRADIDYVTGPGFLEPEFLERRRRGGDQWEAPPQPDPLPALLDLARQLRARGIRLLVLPTPVKPMIHPEKMSRRFSDHREVLDNPSGGRFRAALEEAGVPVLEVGAALKPGSDEAASYLETDTHWLPEAMDRVARLVAGLVEEEGSLSAPSGRGYRRRPTLVEGLGDLHRMLRLPPEAGLFRPERITVQRVQEMDGRPWRADRRAELLLLGDSFTNVFSDPSLGWGGGGGLAEQLSFHLGRPVDRIALNAGGAQASRQALARQVSGSSDRLQGKRIVLYQFAVRELAGGDWSLIDLGGR